MKFLKFKAENGETILFDDYTDNRGMLGSDFWVAICPKCYAKYKHILGNRVDEDGSGWCSVCGCGDTENAEYYVDFSADEVEEIE